jgi:hypothetical protein
MKPIFVVLVLALFSPAYASIEVVISPDSGSDSYEIMRWALYRDGATVKYGRCDILEAQCTPDSPSLVPQREMPYRDYLKRLAGRFQIPEAYLDNHQAGFANYDSYRKVLQRIIENASLPSSEKAEAQQKFDRLTKKGGTLERFYNALALKRELEWPRTQEEKAALIERFRFESLPPSGAEPGEAPLVITYEKSMHQFEKALYPVNFVAPLQSDARRVEEPSTGLTWLLAGTNYSFADAIPACKKQGEGYRMASLEELSYSAAWLGQSTLAESIERINGEKFVWFPGPVSETRKHMGKRYQTIQTSPNHSRSGEFDYFYSTYKFPVAAIWPTFRETHLPLETTEEKSLQVDDIIQKHGSNSRKLAVFCVSPTRY